MNMPIISGCNMNEKELCSCCGGDIRLELRNGEKVIVFNRVPVKAKEMPEDWHCNNCRMKPC